MNPDLGPASESPTLLLVDDDETFSEVMAKALSRRGFEVTVAHSVDEALAKINGDSPEYALVDLKMPGPSGLTLVSHLKEKDEHTRVVVLTGFASIATAVEAIKLGATYYLSKPVNPDEVVAAFERKQGNQEAPIPDRPLSVNRLEWEYINRVLSENEGNISATARALGMHRRTLQRKLAKHPVRH